MVKRRDFLPSRHATKSEIVISSIVDVFLSVKSCIEKEI